MNQDDNKPGGPPEDQEDRTVFMPSSDFPPAQPVPPTQTEETTIPPQAPPPEPAGYESEPVSAPPTSQPPREATGHFQTQFAPRTDGQGIQVGDVLNHIFEVKRFIARGGMGEVFEGVNVNTDERVAIKVMLPSLAADPNVISMFRKEARTLTRLQHEALVQYRVLAQEPQLGVLYIVTEYVDGTNLADVLTQTEATPEELAQLLRRLAAGLRVAHALGAIHRDMSPDNVLLEDGSLGKAKIIDFGIAKDLDPGSATIVGDGFAGKLNYVAPEQLGDFGREVGPWSDVYSLALVILAVAGKRNVQMGGSLVDAVDKRRAGPDLSAAPDALRPVLEQMTRANPAERLRSMDAVLEELDKTGLTGRLQAAAPVAAPAGPNKMVLIGGAIAALLVIAVLGWLVMGRGGEDAQVAGGKTATAVPSDPVEVARGAVNSVLPSVACTWLDIVDIGREGDTMTVALTGVAGNPSAAQSEISRALAGAGINGASINFEEVSTITQSGCGALDTYRQVRAPDGQRLSVPQRKFEKRMAPDGSPYAGKLAATAIINLNVGNAESDFALVGIEPSGVITTLLESRTAFNQAREAHAIAATDLGGDRYRLEIDADHDGWSGIMLLTGKGPFSPDLIAPGLVSRGPDWTNSFVSAAAAGGWQSNMMWFKNVDEVRD